MDCRRGENQRLQRMFQRLFKRFELLGAQVLNSFMYLHRSKAGQTVGFGACAGVHADSDGGKTLFVPVTTGKQIAFYPG